jgi:hypothetical protein
MDCVKSQTVVESDASNVHCGDRQNDADNWNIYKIPENALPESVRQEEERGSSKGGGRPRWTVEPKAARRFCRKQGVDKHEAKIWTDEQPDCQCRDAHYTQPLLVLRLHLTRSRRGNGVIKDAILASNRELYWEGRGETPHSIRDHFRFPGFLQAAGRRPPALTRQNAGDIFAPLSTEKVVKRQEGKICTRC